MKVPLLDLQAQFREVAADVRREIDDVLDSQHFILGPKVDAFEKRLARECQVSHAIGVSSGTDALLVALMALGVARDDEVITTSFSFFATVGGILRLGAAPVFVDIDPVTLNLDLEQVAAAITPRTKAVIPVHLFGRPADLDRLQSLIGMHGIPIVEDAAQALGAESNGRRVGGLGTLGCFSFFPSKNLGAFGDAGAVTTADAELASRVRLLRSHGASPKYFHQTLGGNFRLDAIQAAVLLAKFPYLEGWTRRRHENATLYERELTARGLTDPARSLRLPAAVRTHDRHVYNQYVVLAQRRDALAAHLKEQGIQSEVYYPLPLHQQPCLGGRWPAGSFPVAEACAREALALPIAAEISAEGIAYVVEAIAAFYDSIS